jgi:hypothetical protein
MMDGSAFMNVILTVILCVGILPLNISETLYIFSSVFSIHHAIKLLSQYLTLVK